VAEYRYAGVSPYLAVDRGDEAVEFYRRAFGAEEIERHRMDGDTRLAHATLRINGSDVMLSDEFPEYAAVVGTRPPAALGGTTVAITLSVDDVDRWWERAIEAGAASVRPPQDEFYGRHGKLRDPFGHVWSLIGPKKG
jgi:PhnB protein